MFLEPVLVLTVSDFASRLCILRNERHIATKLQPLNTLLGGIALLRFTFAIPDLLQLSGKSLEESTMLIKIEGMTHYQLLSESHTALAYWLVEGVFIGYSLLLITVVTVWLKTRLMWII